MLWLATIVAIGVLLVAAMAVRKTPLPPRSRPVQFGLRALLIAVGLCSVVFAMGRWLWCFAYDVPHLKELIVQARPLVQQLDDWNTQHGCYPDSLEEARLSSPETNYGAFDYYKWRDGSCGLSIYVSRFHERLEWDSTSRSWGTDMRIVSEIGWSEKEVNRW